MCSRNPYVTAFHGVLTQRSGLAVGGSGDPAAAPESCFRDGLGRLTIPATGIAGAFVETALRIAPDLIPGGPKASWGLTITGKSRGRPRTKRRRGDDAGDFLDSVWRFEHCHPASAPATEWRQGVGIRQATGATAAEKGALYDFEVVPVGAKWHFFMWIETWRDAVNAEPLAALVLEEWARGRCWLGRGPARGTGWMRFDSLECFRLDNAPEIVEAWPDSTAEYPRDLFSRAPLMRTKVDANAVRAEAQKWLKTQRRSTWVYLTIPITITPGQHTVTTPSNGAEASIPYGLDVLQIQGHPSGTLSPQNQNMLIPDSVCVGTADPDVWRGDDAGPPDAPFVTTLGRPFIPGGGIRGPLRHTASRIGRRPGNGKSIIDPNFKGDSQRMATNDEIKQLGNSVTAEAIRAKCDSVTKLFGIEELDGHLLVRDAALADPARYKLCRVEHHAEDEFTAGVFATSKFDRTVLLDGTLELELVIEAPSEAELNLHASVLRPALELARLGHVPIGGGKWRGAGWTKWQPGTVTIGRPAEEPTPVSDDYFKNAPTTTEIASASEGATNE